MGKSQRLCSGDLRAVFRLVGECRDQGDDALAWQTHLLHEARRLVGGQLAGLGMVGGERPAEFGEFAVKSHNVGWPSAAARERCVRWMRDSAQVAAHPALDRFRRLPGSPLAHSRRELVADREWDRSAFVNEHLRGNGLDDGVVSRAVVPAVAGVYMIVVVRPVGDRPCTPRDGAALRALNVALAPHLSRSLWLTTQPNLAGLSPRLRQVLDCLLDGDSEKQAAARLRLSPATVHDHVKRVYRRFGVNSRAELLAHFLRRHRRPPGV